MDYGVITFTSTYGAIYAQKVLRPVADVLTMPVLREISLGCGIAVRHVPLPADCAPDTLTDTLRALSADGGVHGVLLLRPLPEALRAQEILDKAVYASADGLLSDRTETEPGLVVFDLISYPQADKTGIEYNGMLSTFAECPGACVLVALQDSESGEFVAFDYTDDLSQHTNDSGTISQTNMEDNFDNLKPDHQYTIKARAFVLPPEGRTIEGSLYTEASLATL